MREDNEANKLILLLLIIAGFIVLVFFLTRNVPSVLYTENQIRTTLGSTTVDIPETNISVDLTDGSATFEDEMGEGNVVMSEPYFAVKTDEGYDLFGIMRHNMGGIQTIVSLAIFEENEGEATFRGSYEIGDRIEVIDIDGPDVEQEGPYTIGVDYLDHEEFQPKLEPPTVERTIDLDVESHQITTEPIDEEEN